MDGLIVYSVGIVELYTAEDPLHDSQNAKEELNNSMCIDPGNHGYEALETGKFTVSIFGFERRSA